MSAMKNTTESNDKKDSILSCLENKKKRDNCENILKKRTFIHKANENDTLSSIAVQYKSLPSEIKQINKLMSNMIFPGQLIKVPKNDSFDENLPESKEKTIPLISTRNRSLSPKSGKITHFVSNPRPMSPNILLKNLEEENLIDNKECKTNMSSVFSADVEYVTGGQFDVKGILIITKRELRFEPYIKVKKDSLEDPYTLAVDLIKYRMSLAKQLLFVSIKDEKPYRNIAVSNPYMENDFKNICGNNSKNVEIDDDINLENEIIMKIKNNLDKDITCNNCCETENQFITFGTYNRCTTDNKNEKNQAKSCFNSPKYIQIKLGMPKKVIKESPAISALIQNSFQFHSVIEHFFEMPINIAVEFECFIKSNYSAVYNCDLSLTKTEIPLNTSASNKKIRRMLSVAELCNLPLPDMSEPSVIFNEGHIRVIREFLPAKADSKPWQLVYSSFRDGFSLKSLYRKFDKNKDVSVSLIIVQDMDQQIFGALLSDGVKKSEHFYGTGECFLYSFHQTFKRYTWTGKNQHYLKGGTNFFVIGASNGKFGLWLDEELNRGSTNTCETYDNAPLTIACAFKINNLEVWTFPYELK